MNSPAVVTIATTSYATGGFAPVLSIFGQPLLGPGDPSLIDFNAGPGGGPCGIRGTNVTTGLCLDAVLGNDGVSNSLGTLSAGQYLVFLTEQDNTPNGPDLAGGFNRDGQGNFTAVPGVNPGPFVDPSNPNITDTGSYAVSFQNVDNVVQTPEPASTLLLFGGLAAITAIGKRSQTRQ